MNFFSRCELEKAKIQIQHGKELMVLCKPRMWSKYKRSIITRYDDIVKFSVTDIKVSFIRGSEYSVRYSRLPKIWQEKS